MCGCELISFFAPCVAHLLCPIPIEQLILLREFFVESFDSFVESIDVKFKLINLSIDDNSFVEAYL